MDLVNKIKSLTIRALMSDPKLFYKLVLKGGNALQMVYDIINRSSLDIDFSIDGDFTNEEISEIENNLENILTSTFLQENLKVFDVKLIQKPKQGDIPEWKGYNIEFKTIEKDKSELFSDINALRRNAIKIDIEKQSPKFTVDISAYEYVNEATKVEIDGVILKVYTLDMILLEKLRALCQTMSEYKDIVSTINPNKKRARDIYDICCIYEVIGNSIADKKELLEEIFKAKQVPTELLSNMETLREKNRPDWDSVLADITQEEREQIQDYDFYFDKVLEIIHLFEN